MRIYYEVLEKVLTSGKLAEVIIERKDLSGMTEQKKADMLVNLKATYGRACTYRQHNCCHDEGLPCTVEAL